MGHVLLCGHRVGVPAGLRFYRLALEHFDEQLRQTTRTVHRRGSNRVDRRNLLAARRVLYQQPRLGTGYLVAG